MENYLHFATIFEGSNLNYGESFGNIQTLKKIISKNKSYSYISRQALRYDVVRILNTYLDIPLTKISHSGENDKLAIQFDEQASIKDYPEIDFFGYLKTRENKPSLIRKAPVRISDAISLEPYNSEISFSNNMGLAKRNREIVGNNIFQTETHKSFYSFSVTVNLDELGIDDNDETKLDNKEVHDRVMKLMEAFKFLYRDIKGDRKDMAPLFIIGGMYKTGNPVFYNKLSLTFENEKVFLNTELINDVLELSFLGNKISDKTLIAARNGIFENLSDFSIDVSSIESFFNTIEHKLSHYFEKR